MAENYSTGFVNKKNVTGCVKDIMADGVVAWFNGAQPANADATEGTVDLLALFTLSAGAFTGGVSTNGLNMGTSTAGVLSKASAEEWKAFGTAAAGPLPGKAATWGRWYDNSYTTGADTTSARVDFAIGTGSTYEGQVSNTIVVEDEPIVIDEFYHTELKS